MSYLFNYLFAEDTTEVSQDVRKNDIIEKYGWDTTRAHTNAELQEVFDKIFPDKKERT